MAKMFQVSIDQSGGFKVDGFGQEAQNAITSASAERSAAAPAVEQTISAPAPSNPFE